LIILESRVRVNMRDTVGYPRRGGFDDCSGRRVYFP
jgi:hypothetical protein